MIRILIFRAENFVSYFRIRRFLTLKNAINFECYNFEECYELSIGFLSMGIRPLMEGNYKVIYGR